MPRTKLIPLDTYDFSEVLPVRVTDLNRADHLSAYALVGMLDEVYARFVVSLDLGESGLGAPHVGSINAELQVNYLGEGKLHDALLVELAIRDLGSKSFRVHYRVGCGERPIALAEVGVVCFDYSAKKPTQLPEAFVRKIGGAVAR
ncbi:MAG: thioesterase family protein [Myxococcota bacterium]|nr:thioesterase family protein [Myxococcota bacterium]